MSKKTRRKAAKPARPSQPPPHEPAAPANALASVWRRGGLWIALGLFVFANIALRVVDANRADRSAFVTIVFLTLLSIGLAIGYGLEYALTRRRAALEGWDAKRWKAWQDGR